MPTLTIPTTHNPPYAVLALGLLSGAEVVWDPHSGEKGQVTYGDVVGIDAVRAELEKIIPTAEVRG